MTTRAAVLAILADHFGKPAADIRDEHTLADLGDSLEYLEAVMAIEAAFAIEITSAEEDAATTVGKLLELVEGKVTPESPDARVRRLERLLPGADVQRKGDAW